MRLIIQGKNIEVTDRLREYVEKKVGKLDRYLPTITEARMELSVEGTKSAKDRQVAQLTVRSKGTLLRAEERTADMFASIDAIVDKMYRQIVRYKGKRYGRGRGPGEMPPVEEFEAEPKETPSIDEVFVAAIRANDQSMIASSFRDGLMSLDATLAANESAVTGKPVRTKMAGS